jgi:hypothetical protein
MSPRRDSEAPPRPAMLELVFMPSSQVTPPHERDRRFALF